MDQSPSEFLWLEEGEPRHGLVAEVAPVLPVYRTYSFAVPPSLETQLAPGQRVKIPVGRRGRKALAYVVAIDRRVWDSTIRPIDSLVDKPNLLTPHLIELGRRIAEHYFSPLGTTLQAIAPEAARREAGLVTVRYASLIKTPAEIEAQGGRLTAKRRAVLETLAASSEPISLEKLTAQTTTSSAIIRGMAALGWIQVIEKKELRESEQQNQVLVEPPFLLNEEQRSALAAIEQSINDRCFRVTLLYGVSGSGKTEVYVHAMRRVVSEGKQAVLLVPEIVLTTQLVGRLASRFEKLAVMHSGMTSAERSVAFRRIANGEISVVVGTRSAVFAPCPNLGLICVDEEQEPSYKNLRAPRFHVRDVAIMRAKLLGIPVVLGSATPSIETWYRSEHRADYQRLMIRHRVRELPLPKVNLVDMRDELAEFRQPVVISRLMEQQLSQTLHRGEQALILMNRRGFAHRVFCPACRIRLECPNCSSGLVVHTATGHTICHYCRTKTPTPTICPNITCRSPLEHFGLGTQKVEEILTARYPRREVRARGQ